MIRESNMNTDQYHVFMDNIQTTYRVQVSLQSPNKNQSTTSLTVKGCEIDAPAVIEAATKIMDYFCTVSGTAKVRYNRSIRTHFIRCDLLRHLH